MSSFTLRLIALAAMMTDHAGLALFPNIGAFRCVGRLAFPLFCFLIAQGIRHTHDRRAYGRRLILFAFLSEIPFDLLTFGRMSSPIEQNALFSLLFGFLALSIVRMNRQRPTLAAFAVLALALASMLARVSFGWLSIALCLCFYTLSKRPRAMLLLSGLILLLYSLSLQLSGVAVSWVLVSLCSLFSLPLIALYNKKRGPRTALLTLGFYAAYPLHMLALVVIRALRIVPPYFF